MRRLLLSLVERGVMSKSRRFRSKENAHRLYAVAPLPVCTRCCRQCVCARRNKVGTDVTCRAGSRPACDPVTNWRNIDRARPRDSPLPAVLSVLSCRTFGALAMGTSFAPSVKRPCSVDPTDLTSLVRCATIEDMVQTTSGTSTLPLCARGNDRELGEHGVHYRSPASPSSSTPCNLVGA